MIPNIRKGMTIINTHGKMEFIYGVEEHDKKYFSTILADDSIFPIVKAYSIEKKGEETMIEEIFEEKRVLKDLEKATLNHIKEEIGIDALVSQYN